MAAGLQLREITYRSQDEVDRVLQGWGSHSRGTEELCLLACIAVYSVGSQPTFRINMSPPSSGSKNNPIRKLLHACYLLGLSIGPEDGRDAFLRNAC
jgi:hypothetical protein